MLDGGIIEGIGCTDVYGLMLVSDIPRSVCSITALLYISYCGIRKHMHNYLSLIVYVGLDR
jgi:hypothetical protein